MSKTRHDMASGTDRFRNELGTERLSSVRFKPRTENPNFGSIFLSFDIQEILRLHIIHF